MPENNASAQMKASDADRDAVLSDLSEHFQAGRLTAEEFEDRTGQALSARTWGELRDLLRDLPAGPTGPRVPAAGTTGAPPRRLFGGTVVVPIAVLVGIGIAVAVSAGTTHARWGVLWLLLPILLIARRMTSCGGGSRHSGPKA
jgi:Domain of unknown function (DUF1707)